MNHSLLFTLIDKIREKMKNKIFTSCIALGMLVVTNIAAAAAITGDLWFGGMSETTVDENGITSISFVYADFDMGTGDFSEIARGTEVEITDLSAITTPITSFWSVGGFTFDLLEITKNTTDGSGGSDLIATGILSADGYEDTLYTWAYSTQTLNGNTVSTFSANAVPAPAGVALLGFALLGFGAVRRNKKS